MIKNVTFGAQVSSFTKCLWEERCLHTWKQSLSYCRKYKNLKVQERGSIIPSNFTLLGKKSRSACSPMIKTTDLLLNSYQSASENSQLKSKKILQLSTDTNLLISMMALRSLKLWALISQDLVKESKIFQKNWKRSDLSTWSTICVNGWLSSGWKMICKPNWLGSSLPMSMDLLKTSTSICSCFCQQQPI